MRRAILLMAVAAAAVSCLSDPGFETDDINKGPEPEAGTSYKAPVMGSFTSYDTSVPELSSLCLTKDGNSLWSVSDDKKVNGGLYSVSFTGATSKVLKFVHDLEGVTINPATGDLYLAVEGEQAIYRVAAANPTEFVLMGTVENNGATDPSGKGLEGITWYKNDTLIVANQQNPTVLSFFSLNSKEAERHVKITYASYLSDLCYDPVDDVLWISDSNAMRVYIASLDGKCLATYDISSIVGSGKAEGLTVDRAHSCIWLGCDGTEKLFKVSMTWN